MDTIEKKQKKQKGFTLVELLLYICILTVIISGASGFLYISMQAQVKNQTIAEVEQQGDQVMQMITQSIRNADAINLPAQGTSASSLSLAFTPAAQNPTVFDLSGGAIRMTEGTGTAVPLTSSNVSVSNLTFQNLSRTGTPGVIRVSFIINKINNNGRNEYQYSSTFYGSASLR